MQDWGEIFEELLDKYRRDDGSKWSGAAIERATNNEVSGHYVSALRRGEYKDPGLSKIVAISRAVGIPAEEWFKMAERERRT